MTRPLVLVFSLGVTLVAAVGCSKKETPQAAPAASTASALASAAPASDKLEGQLNIIAWPGYIERGETDKAYDWVTPFEMDTGCKVNVKTAAASDEMVALMAQANAIW